MKTKYLILISLFILDLSCASNRAVNDSANYSDVIRVVDGDTFLVKDGSEKGIIIRLIGVDSPESRNTGKKKIGYFGQQSKEYLAKLLENRKVKLEYDADRTDQFGRTLAYVYLPDGTFVNAELVKCGYAMAMTVPPNIMYAEKFVKLQRRARNKNRGLWNEKHIKK